MNPNYTHTITLYNRIRAADTQDRKEKWIRTVISGCFYKAQVNTSLTTQATVSILMWHEFQRILDICHMQNLSKSPQGVLRYH